MYSSKIIIENQQQQDHGKIQLSGQFENRVATSLINVQFTGNKCSSGVK